MKSWQEIEEEEKEKRCGNITSREAELCFNMQCYSPMSIQRPGGYGATDRLTVQCGKCLACLQNRRAEWSIRLFEESKEAISAWFVTLTYSDETVPKINDGGLFPKYTLRKKELQNYFKKLRHGNEGQIKYYAVGEYGSLLRRPHYHIILFNVDSQADIVSAWTEYNKRDNVYDLKGKVDIGNVERKSIHYVTGYLIGEGFEYGKYTDETVEAPFQLISKGIGENYTIDNYTWHHYENRMYMMSDNGHKVKMPRYYKDKMFNVRQKMDFAEQMEKLEMEKPYRDKTQNNQRDTKKANKKSKTKL